jgi:hypothetical protein
MPKKKTGPNRSDFIRSLPSTLSAAEVIAKGKAAGLKISSALVYLARTRKHARPAKAGKAKSAAVPSHAKAANKKPTASDFIRSQPVTMTASSVLKQGVAQGFSFTPELVYAVRRRMKQGGSKARKAGRPKGSRNGSSKSAAAANPTGYHAEFRRLMIRLGLEQSEAIYAVVRGELKALGRG